MINVTINEGVTNVEIRAQEEEVALADRINMVYSGTLVAQGRAVVLVRRQE